MPRAVAAARVDLVALDRTVSALWTWDTVMTGWQACCVTLIFRALQRLQPVLDFLWERRGGILGLGWLSGAVGGLAKSVVGGCYRDGVGIARLPGRGGGGAGRRREGVDGLRRW